ncbi:MAG: phosphatidylserine decarboxylase [Longimicrobiales bacterium]
MAWPTRRHTVRQGDETMAFHLGSTVLLLVGRGHTLDPAITPGTEVHVGQPITRLS